MATTTFMARFMLCFKECDMTFRKCQSLQNRWPIYAHL